MVLKKGQIWGDPTDATKRAHINDWSERQWRHLDTCQYETIIKARIPQLKFSDGTVEELTVPWAERYSRVTTLMAAFVIKLLEACPTTQAVCALTRLSWSTVNAIMASAVERGMLRRTEEEIAYIGIDENSSERGHTYASILTDIDRSRVLDLVPDKENLSQFWSYSYKGAAKRFFKAWSNNVMRSKLEPVNYRARILFHCGKLNLAMA